MSPPKGASGWAAAHPPVHGELPVFLHGYGYPVQGACVVGRVDGPQCQHAPLAIPETKDRHIVALGTWRQPSVVPSSRPGPPAPRHPRPLAPRLHVGERVVNKPLHPMD